MCSICFTKINTNRTFWECNFCNSKTHTSCINKNINAYGLTEKITTNTPQVEKSEKFSCFVCVLKEEITQLNNKLATQPHCELCERNLKKVVKNSESQTDTLELFSVQKNSDNKEITKPTKKKNAFDFIISHVKKEELKRLGEDAHFAGCYFEVPMKIIREDWVSKQRGIGILNDAKNDFKYV